ncbi:MAG: stage 0 sporulation family protein [Bacillota bacterium]|nr:stage 0 sporulation family protein [Bacillota bacterium]
MPTVAGVRFRAAGKIYYFDPENEQYQAGEKVIVETARGLEFGEIACTNRAVPEEQITPPLKKIVRRASPKDEEQMEANRAREKDALSVCAARIKEHNLPMSLVDAEYTFDGQKLIFYFTAENRVDFRELVRDLAGTFKTRIELRQIGVRDEAKMLGGLGPCGRAICCATFLGEFQPVSIRMAKEQHLSLNPTKISGLCGRLMCCLRYECEQYGEPKAAPLEVGTLVVAADEKGEATVVETTPAEAGDPSSNPVQSRPCGRCDSCCKGKPCDGGKPGEGA